MYTANLGDGLRAYTFDGADFTYVGGVDDGNTWGVCTDDNYVYTAVSAAGIFAYTFDGSTFTQVGAHNEGSGTGPKHVYKHGEFLYVSATTDGLRIYTTD